ncbi:hypothetical protein [Nostoc parmelioides]|uniref:Uncharacterized protein n=1 Tax=Nostoc parmelioides FACHB-3921 TaxID=2692909 RepID=A0ABR8B8T2_9NOSO|nr:hypothetical protein [Nostoc parmelioides]MBD2249914.1 hypothetical protein [Nostoc parmelioides FACHB-3921]
MEIIDLTLSKHRWYRRLRGGTWWQVEIPLFDGVQILWVHNLPECECLIIQTENY